QGRAVYWKLDATGREVLRAGGGNGYRPFRSTSQRDDRGNLTGSLSVYLDEIDLEGNLRGDSYFSAENANTYDPAGRLLSHTPTSGENASPRGYTFSHDSAGRCETISNADGNALIERRDYADNGRLWHRRFFGERRGDLPNLLDTVVTYEYDDSGRL